MELYSWGHVGSSGPPALPDPSYSELRVNAQLARLKHGPAGPPPKPPRRSRLRRLLRRIRGGRD